MEITLTELAELIRTTTAPATAPAPKSGLAKLVGRDVIIRTVTHTLIGTLTEVSDDVLTLLDASWIADSGRWADALRDGTLSEVEPFPGGAEVCVGRGAVVDLTRWDHALPREQV